MRIPQGALPLLTDWARHRAQPVTIFDLETTTNIPHVKWMGITELGMLSIHPTGEQEQTSTLVNPERNIPPPVRNLTGINNDDVRGQPTWSVWAQRLHRQAQEHVMIGYNSTSFDCVVVAKQNARYGVEGTEFKYSLDALALPGVSGPLGAAATAHGISLDTLHRALADAWVTAQLVEAVARKHGLAVLDEALGRVVSLGGGNCSPREVRVASLRAFYAEHQHLPDMTVFSEGHGIKKSTAEDDVLRLIDAGEMPPSTIESAGVQAWLGPRMYDAVRACWTNGSEERLKPLFEYFEVDAPAGFDYTQLKLAIRRWKSRGRPPQSRDTTRRSDRINKG